MIEEEEECQPRTFYNQVVCGGSNAIVFDCRSELEYAQGHFGASVSLPCYSEPYLYPTSVSHLLQLLESKGNEGALAQLRRRRLRGMILIAANFCDISWPRSLGKLLMDEGDILYVQYMDWIKFCMKYPFLSSASARGPSYPEGAFFPSEILSPDRETGRGGIFLGGFNTASRLQTLRILDIRGIVDASHQKECRETFKDEGIAYLSLDVEDSPKQDIAQYFPEVVRFIHGSLARGGNVLVHCLAGASRSATLIVAYLIFDQGKGFREALNQVKNEREQIEINKGFITQLESYACSCSHKKQSLSMRRCHLQ
jgi:hypothetical protein